MVMRTSPKDVNSDKMERKLEEHFAINNGQIPNGSFLGEIQRILPIFGVGFCQISKALRVQFGGEYHLGMPGYGDADVSEKEEKEDGVPPGSRHEQPGRRTAVIAVDADVVILLSIVVSGDALMSFPLFEFFLLFRRPRAE